MLSDGEEKKSSVHPDIIKLGWVSFLTDLSSEMIFSVFAIFFTTIAGVTTALLGLIEGLADMAAASLNYTAGWLSDRSGQRKAFALAGYGFSTLAKGILLVSSTVTGLGIFRVLERLGKGFRGPPRDAWIASVADKKSRGYSFGIHKALDKSGAVFGPLIAYALLTHLGESGSTFRTIFWIALIPAVLSIALLGLVKDRPSTPHKRESMRQTWNSISPEFKQYLLPAGIFSLAYFSFSFLLLRAYEVNFKTSDIVLLYALFNAAFVISSPFIGILSDRLGRARILMLGYAIYLSMCLGFVFAKTQWQIIALFIIYGVFYAIDEAQSKAYISDLEEEHRASAIGLYNFLTGMLYLPASIIAGLLWSLQPSSAFFVAAGFALVALLVFASRRARQQE